MLLPSIASSNVVSAAKDVFSRGRGAIDVLFRSMLLVVMVNDMIGGAGLVDVSTYPTFGWLWQIFRWGSRLPCPV